MTTAESFPAELRARYRPDRPLGEGAMGVVWLATDEASGRPVAVKVMSRLDDPRLVQRTLRECELLAELDHPGVLRYLASGRTAQGPYLVTEYLQGSTLEDLPPGSIDPEEVMLQVAEGLEAVHRRGLVHRDLKPANLFLTKDGRAVLLDFGLALDAERTRLTATSSNLLGTPAFMAPEIWQGREAGPASDWYAWGLCAFYLLEGRLPMEPQEILDWAVAGGEWREARLTRSDPDRPFARAVGACLQPDPDLRVGSLADLRVAMRQVAKPAAPDEVTTARLGRGLAPGSSPDLRSGAYRPEPEARGGLAWRAGLGLVVLAAVVGGFLTGEDPSAPPPSAAPVAAPATPAPAEDRYEVGFAQELEQELMRVRRDAVTKTGRRIPVEQMVGEDRLALSSDPVHFRASLEGLPKLWRFLEWIAAGGDLAGLDPRLLTDLADLDGAYQAELGEPVLDPYLKTLAPDDAGPYVSGAWARDQVKLRPGHRFTGRWTTAALRALGEAYRIRAEFDEELSRTPQGPIRGGEVVAVGGLVGATDIDDYLTAVALRPATRNQARDWVLPGILQLRRSLVLARRALESGEPDEELLGCLAAESAAAMGGFFVAGHASLPGAIRDGGPATRPATWFARAEAVRKAAVRLEAFDADTREHRRQLPEMWFRAMAPSPTGDEVWGTYRRSRALWRVISQGSKFGDEALVRRGLEEGVAILSLLRPPFDRKVGEVVVPFFARRPEGVGLSPAVLDVLVALLERAEIHPNLREEARQLRARWAP